MCPKSLLSLLEFLNLLIKSQEKYSFLDLAARLEVTENTLYNWLRYSEKHPMPLGKFLLLGELLGVSPARLCGASTSVFPRLDDPVGAEKQLLELEGKLGPGETKRVIYPLFSPPLMLDPLVKLYSEKGLY